MVKILIRYKFQLVFIHYSMSPPLCKKRINMIYYYNDKYANIKLLLYATTYRKLGLKKTAVATRSFFGGIPDGRTFRQKSVESGLANVLTVNKRRLINQRIFQKRGERDERGKKTGETYRGREIA